MNEEIKPKVKEAKINKNKCSTLKTSLFTISKMNDATRKRHESVIAYRYSLLPEEVLLFEFGNKLNRSKKNSIISKIIREMLVYFLVSIYKIVLQLFSVFLCLF